MTLDFPQKIAKTLGFGVHYRPTFPQASDAVQS
jgi:hypothetical protein